MPIMEAVKQYLGYSIAHAYITDVWFLWTMLYYIVVGMPIWLLIISLEAR